MFLRAHLLLPLGLFLSCLLPLRSNAQFDQIGVYLTWHRDPATTITVNWVNLYPDEPAVVWFREAGETEWTSSAGELRVATPSVLQVRRVELTELSPDTSYEIVLGERRPPPPPPPKAPAAVESATSPTGTTGTSVTKVAEEKAEEEKEPKPFVQKDTRGIYKFRTMPAEHTRAIRFVAGGDMMHSREYVDAMNKRAGALDPDFAVLGGDLAYENGAEVTRWIDWLQSWTRNVRGKGGRLIPMVVGIGNHEVRGGYRGRIPEDAPYFYSLFSLPENRSYYGLDFGTYLSFLVLDTGHTQPISGAQAAWLEKALAERTAQRFLFPVYHWPAYGTTKASAGKLPSETKRSVEIRQQWIPHFERYGVTAVLENDHHNFKRTYPLRGHKRDDKNGIVYLGDGAWGVTTRTVPKDAWYLAKAEPRRHLYHVTLPVTGPVLVEAIDAPGKVFDKTSFARPRTLPVDDGAGADLNP